MPSVDDVVRALAGGQPAPDGNVPSQLTNPAANSGLGAPSQIDILNNLLGQQQLQQPGAGPIQSPQYLNQMGSVPPVDANGNPASGAY